MDERVLLLHQGIREPGDTVERGDGEGEEVSISIRSLIILMIAGIITSCTAAGTNSDGSVLSCIAGMLTIITFFTLAYQAVQVSLSRSDPAEGSSPETWRTYH